LATRRDPDEHDLLTRISARDQAALEALFDRFAPAMQGLALKILGSAEEAEEIVLDVFSAVWRTAPTYDAKRGRVDGWLFMMTRSRALDRIRARQRSDRLREAVTEQASLEAPYCVADPEEEALVSERRAVVRTAMEQLTQGQREVIELAYYKGLSHSEIADQIGEPLGTVKTRIRSGLVKLRDCLTSLLEGFA